jgi:formamidopyrimidine-DNA glycosylase
VTVPELPEVEQAARTLGVQVTGATFDGSVRVAWARTIHDIPADTFGALLAGAAVTGWQRRAKWIVLPLSNAHFFVAHLRMTGRFAVLDRHEPDDPQQRVAFGLTDGREVRFIDQRKFGRIRVLDRAGLAMLDGAHGPEPFDAALTDERWYDTLHHTSRAIKAVLLDQSVIAGIGNIYADEALYGAQLHPLTPADRVSAAQSASLLATIRAVLQQAIDNRGSTLRDYRDSYGAKGTQQDHFRAYGRTALPCGRCGTPIEKITVGQRGTHFCPYCQQLAPR